MSIEDRVMDVLLTASFADADARLACEEKLRALIGERDDLAIKLRLEQSSSTFAHIERQKAESLHEAAEARAAELEKALDDLVMACELPGDHCELQPSLDRARAALAKEKDQ